MHWTVFGLNTRTELITAVPRIRRERGSGWWAFASKLISQVVWKDPFSILALDSAALTTS